MVESPENMEPLFEKCDILAIPIFDGAGMKVKFAEGLSYGKIVVSTSFGAVGYDVNSGIDCFIADNEIAFAECISQSIAMNKTQMELIESNARYLYEENYSINSSIKRYRKFFAERFDYDYN